MPTALTYQFQAFLRCIAVYVRSPLTAWLPVLLSASALSLPTGLYLTASDLGFFSFMVHQTPEMTVFLSKNIQHDTALSVHQKISELTGVQSTQLISEDDALEEFKALTGLHSVASYLPENPLTNVIFILPDEAHANPQGYENLSSQLYRLEYVDLVQFDRDWVTKLVSLERFFRFFGQSSVIILACTTFLLICYMNWWQFHNRVDEMRLLTLIGARRPFIYSPLHYATILQTLLTIGLAFGIVEGLRSLGRPIIFSLTALYGINPPLNVVHWQLWAIVSLAVLLINIGTIQIAAYTKLRRFEPN